MALENSPSLKEFEDGIPQNLSDPSKKKNRLRKILLTLFALLVLFISFSFFQSSAAELLAGKGSLSGLVLDDKGQPFQGDIFILGTELETKTETDGYFLLENIPAGARILIVANDHAGYEFPTLVEAGKTIDIGQLQFITTVLPDDE
ncbi:MAG: carboxypeptidase regulatory-like domain-containing protein [Chloroflexi bacterium]|nr:carboxypeptidase regulatory-like domain-containing protein [Chloroflexota bacterium]